MPDTSETAKPRSADRGSHSQGQRSTRHSARLSSIPGKADRIIRDAAMGLLSTILA